LLSYYTDHLKEQFILILIFRTNTNILTQIINDVKNMDAMNHTLNNLVQSDAEKTTNRLWPPPL